MRKPSLRKDAFVSLYTLVIGTKNWSSWSLRPWLLMRVKGIAFEEIEIPLRTEATKAAILAQSPAGQVPILKIKNGPVIWDSLAIAEALAERHPDLCLWPASPDARARARCVSAEMHSGFRSLREQMPLDCLARVTDMAVSPETQKDIARIIALWSDCRAEFGAGGSFLFGGFSIADAMYAPVVLRFMTYGVGLPPPAHAYADAILALPALAQWLDGCAEWERSRPAAARP